MIEEISTFIDEVSLILVRNKVLTPIDAVRIRHDFDNRGDITFEDFLLEQNIIDKPKLLEMLSEYYQVPANDVTGEFFEHYIVRYFPKDVMMRHFFIPHHVENDNLTIIAANPKDPHLPVIIGKYTTHNIIFNVGYAQDIIDAVREYYDQSITYQPNDIENQHMERSMQEVHPMGEEIKQDHVEDPEPHESHVETEVPHIWEQTVDDYESK